MMNSNWQLHAIRFTHALLVCTTTSYSLIGQASFVTAVKAQRALQLLAHPRFALGEGPEIERLL